MKHFFTETVSRWIDVSVRWLMISSVDPKKASASVKFALLGLVPFIVQGLATACLLSIICLDIDQPWLETTIDLAADAVFFILSAFAAIGFIIAAFRKVLRTANGANKAV